MKAEESALREAQMNAKRNIKSDGQKQAPQSRYIEAMVLQTEKRQREQNAAWEKMEQKERVREVETGQASANTEAFVTDSYRKQLELNKQSQIVTQIEEQINERKIANAETGMMGFYRNFLTKNKAVGGGLREEGNNQKSSSSDAN